MCLTVRAQLCNFDLSMKHFTLKSQRESVHESRQLSCDISLPHPLTCGSFAAAFVYQYCKQATTSCYDLTQLNAQQATCIACWQAVNSASLLRRPQARQNTREFVRGSTVSMPFAPGTCPSLDANALDSVQMPCAPRNCSFVPSTCPANQAHAFHANACHAEHVLAIQTIQLCVAHLHSWQLHLGHKTHTQAQCSKCPLHNCSGFDIDMFTAMTAWP